MKISYILRRRRKRYINEDKVDDQSGSSGSWKSGLTKLAADVKMKKARVVYTFDKEGNIKEITASKVKGKLINEKKGFDLTNLNLGFYIIAPIILGVFLGLAVDNWFNTKSLFFNLFLILGTLASFYNLFKLAKDEQRSTHQH